MKLRHLHLPGLTKYLRAADLQDRLVRAHLDHKATPNAERPPFPCLITFQTPPTYTCGRREIGRLSESQINYLKAGGKAEFHEALRGGQLTWHGPGQMTAYLIVSLKDHGLNTRSHIGLLEASVVATCERLKLSTHTTENPGVWIGTPPDDRKICSVGVHLRRNIASHGIGLNVIVDLSWFDRIVSCGLVGKQATSVGRELKTCCTRSDIYSPFTDNKDIGLLRTEHRADGTDMTDPIEISIPMEEVADLFAHSIAARLPGSDLEVAKVTEKDLWPVK